MQASAFLGVILGDVVLKGGLIARYGHPQQLLDGSPIVVKRAARQRGERPVLLCGGVASSLLLRELLRERCALSVFFGESRFSSDNAVGVAALGYDREAAV